MAGTRRRLGMLAALTALLVTTACSGSAPSATPTPSASPVQRYVALGDSYTAAPGVPETSADDPCQRSTRSYPALVDQALQPAAFVEAACSGAQTTDLAGRQQTGTTTQPPQLDAVTAETDLVTIGIGGNDFDIFTTVVGRCTLVAFEDPTGAPCRRALRTDGGDELLDRLPTIQQRVVAAIAAVHQQAPQARILVIGYPQIIPADGTCRDKLPLAEGDYAYARRVNQGLDQVQRAAATATGTTYVDVWSATAGHDICGTEPWINGQASNTGLAAPYHPFAAEQQAVAQLVVAALRA